MSGLIKRGPADRLRALAFQDAATVVVNSLGGEAFASFDAADTILDRHASVVVDGVCTSGCALLFLAGREKYVLPGSLIGFHGGASRDFVWTFDGPPAMREIAWQHGRMTMDKMVARQASLFNRIGAENGFLFHPPAGSDVQQKDVDQTFWEYGPRTLRDGYGVKGIAYFATPADLTWRDRLWYHWVDGLGCKQFGDDAWVCSIR